MTNPILNQKTIENEMVLESEPMTINGAINKTLILFGLLLAGSIVVWDAFLKGATDKVMLYGTIGFIVSIISYIAIMIKRDSAPIFAPVYAVGEGCAIAMISAQFEVQFPGIVIQAVSLTFMALFVMLVLYRVGAIKCNEKFRSVMMVALLSIMGIYLIQIIGMFFHLQIPFIFGSGLVGIGFSLIVVTIASLSLILDFDFIEKGSQMMLNKGFEWYAAFGLMVTLVWLYLEMLRLVSKLRDR